MNDTEQAVLEVLAGQSPDYLIHPDAAAFVAVGLAPDAVLAALVRLSNAGYAREDVVELYVHATDPVMQPTFTVNEEGIEVEDPEPVEVLDASGKPMRTPRLDENGDPVLELMLDEKGRPVTVDAGWCITEEGRAALPAVGV